MSPVWCLCEQRPPEPGKILCRLCDLKLEDAKAAYRARCRADKRRKQVESCIVYSMLLALAAIGFVGGWLTHYLYMSF